jgi:hypothetical protein
LRLAVAHVVFVAAQHSVPVVAELVGQVEVESVGTSSVVLEAGIADNVVLAITIGIFDELSVSFGGAQAGVNAGGHSRQDNHDQLEFLKIGKTKIGNLS